MFWPVRHNIIRVSLDLQGISIRLCRLRDMACMYMRACVRVRVTIRLNY